MKTLIIPCAGKKIVNNQPQYLAMHPLGNMMLSVCFSGIRPEAFDRICVTILHEDNVCFDARNRIEEELCDQFPIEVLELDNQTSGPAETVYETIKQKNVTGEFVVKDADNYVRIDELPAGNFIAGLDLNTWPHDIHNLRNKSFLILNEQKNILDVIEKQFRSDVICLGLYGFSSAERYTKAYDRLNVRDYPVGKLYLSHVISYMIGFYGKVFRYVPATEYENWGNQLDWTHLQERFGTFFINLDELMKHGAFSEAASQKLKAMQKNGAAIAGFTVRDKSERSNVENMVAGQGVTLIGILYNCHWSGVRDVVNTEEQLLNHIVR